MNKAEEQGVIAWFVHNPVAANLLMIGIIILGFITLTQLRQETFPSIPPNRITVSVTYESGSAKLAETGIALKIEQALETVSGIKRVTSVSNAAGSTVTVERLSDYDLNRLLRDVKNKVDGIYNLPVEAEKPVIEAQRFQDHGIYVQLYGQTSSLEIQELADELKRDLLAKSGISDVRLLGKAKPMISIDINETALQTYGLTFSRVADKLNSESFRASSSTLRSSDKNIRIKVGQQSDSLADFINLPLLQDARGVRLRLGDVATITDGVEDEPAVMVRYNNKPGVTIEVLMDQRSDVHQVIRQATEVVENWKQSQRLPEGIELDTWYDSSEFITERLQLMLNNILQGMALVFLVLALFINLRIAFWVAMSMPFVFMGTFFFMGDGFLALSINEMTTFGFIMALGIVVDDAVVVGESVASLRQKGGQAHTNAIRGTLMVAIPTVFGVLTTVAAFFPLSQVSGEFGSIFAQFALIVTVALLMSMLQSKLVLPSHLASMPPYSTGSGNRINYAFERVQSSCNNGLKVFFQHIYRPLLRSATQYRYASLLLY